MYTPLLRVLACVGLYIIAVEASPSCQDVAIPVSASALNYVFPANLNLTALSRDAFNSLVNTSSTELVSGTYTIRGTYCEPSKPTSRQNTLQILAHGITYTRSYWSGTQFNTTIYSWVDYADAQGYPTLALDRLCYGESSLPNGLLVCQEAMSAQVMHEIVQQTRAGQIAGRSFSKIIYVGHSTGSLIGNVLAQQYPSDVDSYILTGFTPLLAVGGFEFIVALEPLPAILVAPERFPIPDLTYVLPTSASGARGDLYYGDYDPAVAAQDYATRGTFPLGEIATVALGQLPALEYTNSVLVLNGENDQVFCSRLPTDPLVGDRGDCGNGSLSYTALSKLLFPNARSFQYSNTADTGHDVNLHLTAQQSYQVAHQFLSNEGF